MIRLKYMYFPFHANLTAFISQLMKYQDTVCRNTVCTSSSMIYNSAVTKAGSCCLSTLSTSFRLPLLRLSPLSNFSLSAIFLYIALVFSGTALSLLILSSNSFPHYVTHPPPFGEFLPPLCHLSILPVP